LVFRRVKRMLPPVPPKPEYLGRAQAMPSRTAVPLWPPPSREAALRYRREQIEPFRSMPVGPVAPVAPFVGQLWHQTGVRSETVPKLERVLRWDGAEWVIAGLVSEGFGTIKQGMQVCGFQEAVACAYEHTRWEDCEFIYTYDGSTWGNA